jgi:hypothetical protein
MLCASKPSFLSASDPLANQRRASDGTSLMGMLESTPTVSGAALAATEFDMQQQPPRQQLQQLMGLGDLIELDDGGLMADHLCC